MWQDGDGENHGRADQGSGRVSMGAVSSYVCTDLLDPIEETAYALTLIESD